MPHTVHVSRTVTTTTSGGLLINSEAVKSLRGILKISQVILGIICISLLAHYTKIRDVHSMQPPTCFFFVTSVTFFIGSLLLLISSLFSFSSDALMRKTLFEPLYNGVAFILYFAGAVAILVKYADYTGYDVGKAMVAAGSLGLINSILYGVGAYDSYRAFKSA